MKFQLNKTNWPQDYSEETLFFVSAVRLIGEINHGPGWSGPSSVFNFDTPLLEQPVTEDDRRYVAEMLSSHDPEYVVRTYIPERADSIPTRYDLDVSETLISGEDWSRAQQIGNADEAEPSELRPQLEAVLLQFAIAAAKKQLKTFVRSIGSNETFELPPQHWNVSLDVLRARYALGQMNARCPNMASPRGNATIFVDQAPFKTWLAGLDRCKTTSSLRPRSTSRRSSSNFQIVAQTERSQQ